MPDPTVWPIEANGADPIVERFGYLTDVLATYTNREQRVCLRHVPLESYEFGILGVAARESELAAGLLYDASDELVAVPLWHYGSKLTSAVAPGGALLAIPDAADCPYLAGGYALVWRDAFTWELFSVSGTSGAGVATSDTSAGSWAIGSYVYPVRVGRLSDREALRWETSRYSSGRITWTMEQAGVGTIIGASVAATTYRNFEVLEVEPSRADGIEDKFERRVYLLDTGTGTRTADAAEAVGSPVRDIEWQTYTRAEARALREFMDRRGGRRVPFWVSAWEEDLALAVDAGASASSITVLAAGYTARHFAAGRARRHVAIRTPDGPVRYREVLSAVDNGNGTETLTLDSPVPEAMVTTSTTVSFLRFVRLDEDSVSVEWTAGFASSKVAIRDLPGETP